MTEIIQAAEAIKGQSPTSASVIIITVCLFTYLLVWLVVVFVWVKLTCVMKPTGICHQHAANLVNILTLSQFAVSNTSLSSSSVTGRVSARVSLISFNCIIVWMS